MHGVGWILFNGVVSILLGGLIWYDGPGAAVWIIGTLVGIHLIFNGITRLMIWSAVRKAVTSPARRQCNPPRKKIRSLRNTSAIRTNSALCSALFERPSPRSAAPFR